MAETRFSAWLSERLAREKLNYTSLAHLVDESKHGPGLVHRESTPSPRPTPPAPTGASPADNWRLNG